MLEIVIVTIFISTFLNIFFKRYSIPTIIWYIITWVCISFLFDIWTSDSSEDLKLIAEFWIVFLMFTIWLEFSVKHLLKMKEYVFLYWSLQFFITTWFFFVISRFLLWINSESSVIIASWLSLSSTAIVLKVLNDTKEINKKYWQKSLWILLFQDIIVIPIILLISIFSQKQSNVWLILFETLADSIALMVILWIFGRYVLEVFLEKVHKINSNEVFMWSILIIVMWASYFSHYLGLSYSIWAFIAWMMIAWTSFKYKIEAWLIPFRSLLLWIFFVTVWMQLDFSIIFDYYHIVIMLIFALIIFKTIILFLILLYSTPKSTALRTALTLFQVWEFAIVIFELAKKEGLISSIYAQVLIIVTILSMVLTPFILKYMDNIVKLFIKTKYSEFTNIKELKDHIVLIWYGRVWSMVSEFLNEHNLEHVIIENDLNAFSLAKNDGRRVFLWNAYDDNMLENVSILNANYIIISIWFSYWLVPIVNKIEKIVWPEKIIVKVSKFSEKEALEKHNIKNIIVETEKTANTIIDYLK